MAGKYPFPEECIECEGNQACDEHAELAEPDYDAEAKYDRDEIYLTQEA